MGDEWASCCWWTSGWNQRAHFDLPESGPRLPGHCLVAAINALLPSDIRILSAARTCQAFQARFGATSKEARDQIWNAPVMNPMLLGHAWHVPQELDLTAVREAAALLLGHHDFRAFTSRRDGNLTEPTRTLTRCDVHDNGLLLTFIIEGDGFLYKMCRGIVGTLVKTGRGQMTCSEVKELLIHPATHLGKLNAPAQGLVLCKVSYSPRLNPE